MKLHPVADTESVMSEHSEIFNPLGGHLNETYLWHVTFIRHALAIAQHDFRIGLAGESRGKMYGHGVDLAAKADEYAKDEPGGYYQGLFVLLLCRTLLGKYYYTKDRDEKSG